MSRIAESLRGGDPRSLAGVPRVVAAVLNAPERVDELLQAMTHDDAMVRMRAADAVEKLSRTNPELRWHLAQIVPRLRLDAGERKTVVAMLTRFLDDSSDREDVRDAGTRRPGVG